MLIASDKKCIIREDLIFPKVDIKCSMKYKSRLAINFNERGWDCNWGIERKCPDCSKNIEEIKDKKNICSVTFRVRLRTAVRADKHQAYAHLLSKAMVKLFLFF